MNDSIIVAIITTFGAVVIAIIGLYGRQLTGRESALPAASSSVSPVRIEEVLRRDRRVQRLLRNKSWQVVAEAAIASLCHGVDCPVESWRESSVWQQVAAVYTGLTKGA